MATLLHSSQHQKMAAKHNHRVVAIILLQLTTVLLSVVLPFTRAATSLAKPGCDDRCGDVVIPYPFGIGASSCFTNDWFEVVCGDNNKPVLKKLDVVIKEVRVPAYGTWTGWILVENPIMASSSDCLSGTAKITPAAPLDFTGSNFYYSHKYNSFVGSGCSNTANLIDKKLKNVPDTGCSSSCPSDTKIGDCCKSTIPISIQLFNVSFASAADDTECKYAMIVSAADWLDNYPTTSCSSAIRDAGTAPAWIEWGLKSSSAEAQALLEKSKAKGAIIGIDTYTYDDGNDVQFAYCQKGFEGSAYVTDGCQDIDECTVTPGICTNGTCANTYGFYQCIPVKAKTSIAIKVASPVVGSLLIIGAIWLAFWFIKRRQERKYFERNGGKLLESEEDGGRIKIYKAHELKKATNNFNEKNRLGAGGQGTVYKGTLKGGTPVAIKLCNKIEPSKKKSKTSKKGTDIESGEEPASAFITEVTLVSKTLHTNIVKMLGCCLDTKVPMLVFERLVNGDLAQHLQKDRDNKDGDKFTLSWETRLKIALQTAEGLSYLHLQAGTGIYHRDVKTDNILLDNTFTAKLADFGISQSTEEPKNKSAAGGSNEVPGSAGYMDPEYMDTGKYTDKSDVYSFGVVLAELLTGKKPVYPYLSKETGEQNMVILANYFKELETEKIMGTFLDARVKHQGKKHDVEAVIAIAKRCLEREGKNRPKMKEVVIDLEKIRSKQNEVYAEEIEEPDYEASVEITASPLGGNQTKPLRHQESTSSDIEVAL